MKISTKQLTAVFARVMGAREVQIYKKPGTGLAQEHSLVVVWDWAIPLEGPSHTAEGFEKFWAEVTRVIAIPRVAELQAELRHIEAQLVRAEETIRDLERYKIAHELGRR